MLRYSLVIQEKEGLVSRGCCALAFARHNVREETRASTNEYIFGLPYVFIVRPPLWLNSVPAVLCMVFLDLFSFAGSFHEQIFTGRRTLHCRRRLVVIVTSRDFPCTQVLMRRGFRHPQVVG